MMKHGLFVAEELQAEPADAVEGRAWRQAWVNVAAGLVGAGVSWAIYRLLAWHWGLCA